YKRISGASRGFRKSLYEYFGSLNVACPTEDTPMLLRGLLRGYAVVANCPAIFYRKHKDNLSGQARFSRMNFDEIRKQYLDDLEKFYMKEVRSCPKYKEIENWIDGNYIKRRVIRRLHENGNNFSDIYSQVLVSKN